MDFCSRSRSVQPQGVIKRHPSAICHLDTVSTAPRDISGIKESVILCYWLTDTLDKFLAASVFYPPENVADGSFYIFQPCVWNYPGR